MAFLGGIFHAQDTTSALVQVSKRARVERGPARKTTIATREFLEHPQIASHYRERMVDAAGEQIQTGKPMEYLDWKGEWVWYVYRFQDGKWARMGFRDNRIDAIEYAKTL